MRISRLIAMLVGALALSAVFATGAHAADPYPPVPPVLTTSDPSVPVNGAVTFNGTGFDPGELVDIFEVGPGGTHLLGKVRADANGNFSVSFTLTDPGQDTIRAVGESSGFAASIVENVLAPAGGGSGGGGGLPKTGSDFMRFVTVGGSVLLGGLVLVLSTVMWRRRSTRLSRATSIG